MKIVIAASVVLCLAATGAQGQTPPPRNFEDVLIDVERPRIDKAKKAVHMRAILVKPKVPTETALLMFRGSPGYANIESVKDKLRNQVTFFRKSEPLLIADGIAPVIMDCSTDQWGDYGGPGPTNCFDDYRSSKTHADDVRAVISTLREAHGFKSFYVLGHSQGTVSSRWLARNLGPEIVGSIHSSAINVANPRGYAKSMSGFKYAEITTPILHVHNEKDRCVGTPYAPVKAYAGDKLVTVRNSIPGTDPCRDGPHGHEGVEELVARTIITWIKTRQFERVIGP